MDEIKIIIENTKVDKQVVEIKIKNPITEKKYPQRLFFVLLKKYVDDFLAIGSEPRMVGMAGLRGTGKTTLMWQIAEYILNNQQNIPIYFFNVNDIITAGYNLHKALKVFEQHILKKSFRELDTPVVLLFDEVHDDENWAQSLKILYDEARTAFILCTGSSALLLQQTADLARRMKIERVYPFRFIEFITAKSFLEKNSTIYPQKGLSNSLKQIIFYSDTLNDLKNQLLQKKSQVIEYYQNILSYFGNNTENLILEYIKYHNIPAFLMYREKTLILGSIRDLFARIIDEDIRKIKKDINFNIPSDIISKLLLQLAISDEINFDVLSNKSGIKKEEIENILDILDKAELLIIMNTYGGAETRIWKNKKIFFMSPSLRLALLSIIYGQRVPDNYISKLYEDIVAMYLTKTLHQGLISVYKQKNEPTPDFMISTMEKPIALEVGIGKQQTNQFSNIDCRYGILVSNNIDEISVERNYLKLPLDYFLLL